MSEVVTDDWTGCYREGWGRNRLRPASFAHPAKNSYGLSVRIYEHALEEGWVKPGDYLIDIFAGVGGFALEAMRHGLHFVGMELEQRFVDMGQGCNCTGISKADWVRYQGRWDRMRYEDGRHWCPECLMKACAVADEREFKPLPLPGTKWAVLAKTHQATLFDAAPTASYVRNSGKIPCTGAHRYHGNIETWEQDGMAGTAVIVQGDSRRLGEVLERASLCLSSPPYSPHGVGHDAGHPRLDATEDRRREDDGCGRRPAYGSEPGQLAQMPEGELALALGSPPYAGSLNSPQKCGINWEKAGRPDRCKPSAKRISPQVDGGMAYRIAEGQLAALPEGDHAAACERPVCAISSPPFGGAGQHTGGKPASLYKQLDGRNAPRNLSGMPTGEGYGNEQGQLGQMPLGDHAAVAMPSTIDFKTRQIANHHPGAQAACEAWLSGSLLGNPIVFSPGNIHVYGVWLRDWSRCFVQFMDRQIIVVKPIMALEAEEPKLVTLGNYGIMSSKMEVIQCQTTAKIAENQYQDVLDVASHVAKNMSAKHSKDVKSQRDLEPKLRQPDSTPQCLIAGEKPILIGKAEVFAGEDTLGKSSAVQPLSEMGANVSSAVPQIISRFTTKKADQRQMEPGTTNLTTSKPCVLPVTLPCTAPPTLRPLAQYVEKNTEQDHGTLVAQKNAEGNLGCVPSGNSTQKQKETLSTFWAASRQILEQVYQVLAPGAHAIWVLKMFVRSGRLVDFPRQWETLCQSVGFKTVCKHRAWMNKNAGIVQTTFDGDEVSMEKWYKSFFKRLCESKGSPRIDWELILCMVKE